MNKSEEQQLERVRRAGEIRSAINLGGILLLGALTTSLGLTTWRLMDQQHVSVGDSQTPKQSTNNQVASAGPAMTPVKEAIVKVIPAPAKVSTPNNAKTVQALDRAVNDLQDWINHQRISLAKVSGDENGKLPPLDQMLETWIKKWKNKSEPSTADPIVAELKAQLATSVGEANSFKDKVKQLEGEKSDLEVALEKIKDELGRKIAEFNIKISELNEKQKVAAQRLNALRDKIPTDRNPDPTLATLVIAVDAQSPLEFLMDELIALYSYHNTKTPDGQIVSIDLAQGGKLKRAPTSSLPTRTLAELESNYPYYIQGLEMNKETLPALEAIPEQFPLWFSSIPPQKKIQLVLVAGGECTVPSGNSWDDVTQPVHVCIFNDGRELAPDFEAKWKVFTRRRSGQFLLLDVDYQNQISRMLAEARFRIWLEDLLCFTSTSAR